MKIVSPKRLFLILSLLIIAAAVAWGASYYFRSSSPHAKFSTSYTVYPLPQKAATELPKTVVEVSGTIQSFDVNAEHTQIAIATSKGISMYDLKSLQLIQELPVVNGVYALAFSPDGAKLALLEKDTPGLGYGVVSLLILDTTSWETLYTYRNSQPAYLYPDWTWLKWNPDSQRIAFAIPEQGLMSWNPDSGLSKLESAPEFTFAYGDFDWSPDGSRIVLTEPGLGLRRVRLDTRDWVRLYDPESQPAARVAWSPNGKYIASGHGGGTVCIWNASNNQCEGFIIAHANSVDGLDWSPDSRQIATSSGAIRVWDAKTGKEESAFGYSPKVNYTRLKWIDAHTLATLETSYMENRSPTIKFWDDQTGNVVVAFRGWQNLISPNYDGVTLRVDDIQISGQETMLQTSLMFDYSNVSAQAWDVELKDDQGQRYLLTRVDEQNSASNTEHIYRTTALPKGKTFTLNLNAPEGLSLARDTSQEYNGFIFDPTLFKSDTTVEMNQEIYAGDFLFYLMNTEKISDTQIRLDFFTANNLTGIDVKSTFVTGSQASETGKGRFSVLLTFSKIPQDLIELAVDKVYYKAFGPWPVEFEVLDSMK
ncbi:MAG: hypothetical protein IT310_08160 [Anaerolineales bacterium]|nr:hypothetical protein [Anaerolineales bacterium]